MSIIDSIVSFFKNRAINKVRVERSKSFHSLSDAKSVGIVINMDDDYSEEAFNLFKSIFKKNNIHHKELALDVSQKPLNLFWCLSNPEIIIINKKDVNRFGVPQKDLINDFCSEEFDILIYLSTKHCFTADYIIASSHAKLIVGTNIQKMSKFDIEFVAQSDKNNFTTLDLSKDIILYLTKIKSL